MNVLRVILAVVISVVWAVVYLAAIFSHGQINAPPEISGVMLAVVTWLFGAEIRRQLKNGKSDDDG